MKNLVVLLAVLFFTSCQSKYIDEINCGITMFHQLDSDKKIMLDETTVDYDNDNPTAVFASNKKTKKETTKKGTYFSKTKKDGTVFRYYKPNRREPITKVEKYIDRYYKTAQEEYKLFGILPSIKLAQGILESGVGESKLASVNNNHFGIKAGRSWKGKVTYRKTKEWDKKKKKYIVIKAPFRSYKSSWYSFRDHSLLLSNDWYKPCKECGSDWKCWAIQLKKCGYATDIQYTKCLIRVIEQYKLYEYDYK